MKEINPPAIVREDTSELEQLAWDANAAIEAGVRATRQGVERFIEAGERLLAIKAKCKHGQWLPTLEKYVQCSQRQAYQYILVARNKAKVAGTANLEEALKLLATNGKEEEIGKPPKELKLCDRCKRVGAVKDCEACKELRRPSKPKEEERCEGGDEEAERKQKEKEKEAGKNGQLVFDWKDFGSAFGKVARAPDAIAKAFPGEKQSQEYKVIRDHLQEVARLTKEWKKRLLPKE